MNKQKISIIITAAITTIIIIVVFILLMPVIGPRFLHPIMMGNEPAPANLDTSSSRLSEDGLFQVSWSSEPESVPLNQIHTWRLHVETSDGELVENATILVDGGMPQHGHGLPTNPQVTEYLGNGDYLVEGMRFQMTGFWEVRFVINAGEQSDSITFNLDIK
ncbi:MAG TPA: FixH family protein [Anaerolineaceae bacterium]|nr:FixH family protein [Anaerolineaceae bacterium]